MPFRQARTLRTILIAIGVLATAVVVATVKSRDRLTGAARRQWRDGAIARVEKRLADEKWLTREVDRLKAASPMPFGGWAGDHVLVMRNGDWIICENLCSKENPRIHDLFIGRGSDGRWYYSTFHFCIDRVALALAGQPHSLAQFADAYYAVPFDGRSDDCLKITWTGGPWGDEKMAAAAGPGMPATR
jgi:hypothetical protein